MQIWKWELTRFAGRNEMTLRQMINRPISMPNRDDRDGRTRSRSNRAAFRNEQRPSLGSIQSCFTER